MTKNIYTEIFNNKYSATLKEKINNHNIDEIRDYIGKRRFSNQYLNWLLKHNEISSDAKNIFADEIKKRKVVNDKLLQDFLLIFNKESVVKFLNTKIRSLTYVLYVISENKKYTEFTIKKKNGKERIISSPNLALKKWQKKLNEVLQLCYINKIAVHGFIANKSIITNAFTHIKKRNVLNIDIKDFFPSINFGRIRGLFLNSPFNFTKEAATILAQICTFKNQLPQGAPTSPIISNFICSRLDQKMTKLGQKYYCTYTRYADDITFSNTKNNLPENLIEEIINIIREEGFEVNEAKVRNQTRVVRQEVTGLTVNEKININRKYIRKVRAILHSWETEGYETASKKFFGKYDRHRYKRPSLRTSIKGKIEFIGSIRGKNDDLYKKLLERYKVLIGDPNVEKYEVYREAKKQEREKFNKAIESKKKLKWMNYDKELKHNPKELVKSLQLLSNPSANLRNLVHKPSQNESFDLPSIFRAARCEFNKIKVNLPSFVRHLIEKKLFEVYKKNGFEIWNKNKLCPLVSDEQFYKQIQSFKRKYRFGKADIEETNLYTALQKMIKEDDLSKLIGKIDIDVKVEEANFYTDVDAVIISIRKILNMCIRFGKDDNYKLKIDYYKEGRRKILEICHL